MPIQLEPQNAALGRGARQEFLGGVKGMAPVLLGVFPFGLIYGILAIGAGLPAVMAQGMSIIVFAGSAQFVIAQLAAINTPLVVIAVTAAVINIRHVFYSASLAPYLASLSMPWKMLLSYLLTDEAYAVTITHYVQPIGAPSGAPSGEHSRPNGHWFFLGAGLALWITWQITTAIGIFVGAQIPASWQLDFSLPLTFIALVVPMVRDRANVAAVVVAGAASLLVFHMPLKLGLVTAILFGIIAGMAVERGQ